jgi:acetyl-CoA acetyltransferase
VTAGNSSQTSDGAAAVVVMSEERARALGITPLARWVGYATAGVAPERFGTGPVPAVRKLLGRLNLTLADIDLVELNEAFAVRPRPSVRARHRSRSTQRQRRRDRTGPPAGCTGARLTTRSSTMGRRKAKRGLIKFPSGWMGVAGMIET